MNLIYFLRAILYALAVLKRASYVTVTAEKLLEQNMSNEQAFTKSLIGQYISSTVFNYKILSSLRKYPEVMIQKKWYY